MEGGLRLAEVIAALSLAIDLGLGQPMTHVLRTCLLAVRLGRVLGLAAGELADTYYATLLRFVGCTADSHDLLDFAAGEDVRFRSLIVTNGALPEELGPHLVRFMTQAGVGGDIAARVRAALESPVDIGAQVATVHCEVATMLATRLGLGGGVCDALGRGFERWDGHGFPAGCAGDAIPMPVRLAVVARDVEVLTRTGSREETRDALRQRRGRTYDPRLVDVFLKNESDVLAPVDDRDVWDELLRCEPAAPRWIAAGGVDEALTAFADFADSKTPFTLGHSRGVAELADGAARHLGWSQDEAASVRRAGLLHDIGRSGIPNAIWEQPGTLAADQWERVRLHAYYTERVTARCHDLRPVGALAASHHERVDGSGYHRGSRGGDLDMKARVLAAADACQAMLQVRPYRAARSRDATVRELRAEAAGRLDARAVEAVAAAAGVPSQRKVAGPCHLTEREIAVLRLMVRGHSNREMAGWLGITPKTVGHHVQHIYDKIGVSTRAAAALFALDNQLL